MRSVEEKQCEDFWGKWKEDPVGLSEICGYALAKSPLYYEQFLYTFGETLFRDNRICERIDFLYKDSDRKPQQHSDIFHNSVDWGIHEDTIKITDKEGTYDSLTIYAWTLYLSKSSPYSIRAKIGHNWLCWAFVGGDELTLSFTADRAVGRREGFMDIRSTKMVVDLLVWTTNVLGFKP